MNIVKEIEAYITKYVTLKEDYYALPLALWTVHTHCWELFDTTPYLVITKPVKRAGGTRLMEVLSYMSALAQTFSPDSPAAMMRTILFSDKAPSCFIDEAEQFNENNHPAREFLNKGYRRGQTIPKVIGGKPVDMETFCPKCFVLIGDVYSTLRDRTMTVIMRRQTPIERANAAQFRMTDAKDEGATIRTDIANKVQQLHYDIKAAYTDVPRLAFLNDRDEEVWKPLFALAKVLCPERIPELERTSVDMSTEKQAEARKESRDEEIKADLEDSKIYLLKDMLLLSEGKRAIMTRELLDMLKAIPTSQWRKYKGRGLTDVDMGVMLDSLNVHPRNVRFSKGWRKGEKGTVQKAYRREDLIAAAKLAGLLE